MFFRGKNSPAILSLARKFDLSKDFVKVEKDMPSVLCQSLVINGNIEKDGDIHIEGQVRGNVQARALVLGPHARITGDVNAEHVRCSGQIEGNIVSRVVELFSTARVKGNIEHETLTIESGARVEGLCCCSISSVQQERQGSAFGAAFVEAVEEGSREAQQGGREVGEGGSGSARVFGAEPQ